MPVKIYRRVMHVFLSVIMFFLKQITLEQHVCCSGDRKTLMKINLSRDPQRPSGTSLFYTHSHCPVCGTAHYQMVSLDKMREEDVENEKRTK